MDNLVILKLVNVKLATLYALYVQENLLVNVLLAKTAFYYLVLQYVPVNVLLLIIHQQFHNNVNLAEEIVIPVIKLLQLMMYV